MSPKIPKTLYKRSDFDRIWFTSDHHFGHKNIIKICSRPFRSVEEMDQVLIDSWNARVQPADIVYHLGDFTLGDDAKGYFSQLNGHVKFLTLPWHHDKRWLAKPRPHLTCRGGTIQYLPPLQIIYLDLGEEYPLPLTLSHYPLAEWEAAHHGGWHLHGHSHGNLPYDPRKIMDVGVDVQCTYAPISLREIVSVMMFPGD